MRKKGVLLVGFLFIMILGGCQIGKLGENSTRQEKQVIQQGNEQQSSQKGQKEQDNQEKQEKQLESVNQQKSQPKTKQISINLSKKKVEEYVKAKRIFISGKLTGYRCDKNIVFTYVLTGREENYNIGYVVFDSKGNIVDKFLPNVAKDYYPDGGGGFLLENIEILFNLV